MKVLIADDNAATREVMKSMCEKLGHETVEAKNGEEALEICQQQEIPIIISDLVMPKLDGIQLCKQIRNSSEQYDPFFFLITGKMTSKLNYDEALKAGVDDFMYKPTSYQKFRESFEKAAVTMSMVKTTV